MADQGSNDEDVVQVDGTGKATGCAKDYSTGTCGYTAGSKVCGKCGALAVEVKAGPMDNEDDLLFSALEEKATMLECLCNLQLNCFSHFTESLTKWLKRKFIV